MFSVKDVESKVTPAKKNIKISNVRCFGGHLVDEEGSIVEKLAEVMGDDEFTIKITVELPEDEDAE